jgi:riboflavin kinase, archaea type
MWTSKEKAMEISGVIHRGAGKGAYFTQLDWVIDQCERKLNMTPFPGTLNVRVNEDDFPRLGQFLLKTDFELLPDDTAFCAARLKKVTINGVAAAVVLPSMDVRIHDNRTIELIAGCSLKERLGLDDGDGVTISDERIPMTEMDTYREIFEFATSAGALEGYLFKKDHLAAGELDDWIDNLVKQYQGFPSQIRAYFQTSLDRTIGRAVHSLVSLVGPDHHQVLSLKSMIVGELPASSHDFDREKEEKAEKYGS